MQVHCSEMIKKVFLYILLLMLTMACVEEDSSADASIVKVGDELPNFSVYTSDSIHVSRDSLVGHRSVVVFFNTSCADCRKELPCVDSLYRALSTSDDFRLVCIARNEETPSIEQFWDEHNLEMPYSPQNDRRVYNLFARSIIPRIYISSKDGVVRFVYGDSFMPSFNQLLTMLNSL